MAASIPEAALPSKIQLKLRRHGLAGLLHILCVRAANALFPFKILRGVYVERPDPAFLAVPEPYSARFLDAAALRAFASPENELSLAFIDHARMKGDECYALLGGGLAAYGWYATTPTAIGLPHLQLHFSKDYVYMYKGFTGERHRGKRLHAVGMTRALNEYRQRGYRGLVSYVESTNFDSLKSCDRMGYKVFGSIYLVRLFGRQLAFSSPGCRALQFRVEKVSTPRRGR
jgi:hypothetical protein